MTKTQLARLRKLEKFLRTLPPEKFDINFYTNRCGSVCCALGWCPTLFPRLVKLEEGVPTHASGRYGFSIAIPLFGISRESSIELFTADCTNPDPTPTEVADKIARFIDQAQTEPTLKGK